MNAMLVIRVMRASACAGVILALAGCATPGLDKQIAQLRSEVRNAREALAPIATPYHALAGKEFQIDVSKRPITDVFAQFNGLSAGDRIIGFQSLDRAGYIDEFWTKCWPFNSRIGVYIKLAFDEALQGVLYLEKMPYTWKPGRGLEFDFRATGVGAAILVAGIKLCGFNTDVAPFPVAIVFPPIQDYDGRIDLEPNAEGIQYRLMLDHKPFGFVGACLHWCVGWPIHLDYELTDGVIRNIAGKAGEVQISKLGAKREFTLDFNFDSARFLDARRGTGRGQVGSGVNLAEKSP